MSTERVLRRRTLSELPGWVHLGCWFGQTWYNIALDVENASLGWRGGGGRPEVPPGTRYGRWYSGSVAQPNRALSTLERPPDRPVGGVGFAGGVVVGDSCHAGLGCSLWNGWFALAGPDSTRFFPGFDTLAVRIWSTANDLFYARAAAPALLLVAVSAVPTYLILTRMREPA